MKISFIIATLNAGGAERVCVSFANELCKEQEISIIKFHKEASFYELDERIKLITLRQFSFANLYHKIASRIKKFLALREAIKSENSDVYISFLDSTNIACLLANIGLNKPLIICEHSSQGYLKSKFWRFLRRLSYPKARLLTVLSNEDKSYYESFVKDVRVLLNPCHFSSYKIEKKQKENLVLFVGRLDENKNAAMFLRAISRLDERLKKEYSFVIAGDGILKESLESLAKELSISVKFLGKVNEISKLYERAKALCLCSFVEGLPTVLIESLYFDVLRISTRYSGNLKDLIEDKKDGLLVDVDDDEALAKALTKLLCDEKLSLELLENAKLRKQSFDTKILSQRLLSFAKDLSK
ncbi:glycosyltransferase [Campylobacter avium]|uniref:GalNAc-alpha-(1->4)-GalNAc-alpha-(1->3)- diNAcBac-PP-undecaprenol alpha-1,4-N-acetyl-D-galactosaminyltransferase n=1 Tax=Campylobacter avium TaxID=522485 RepID=UPI0023539DED|nr:glycosyltransferase [Campylobacter avium]